MPQSVIASSRFGTLATAAPGCARERTAAMTRAGVPQRRCFDCDATSAEAAFVGDRKPLGQRDRCFTCQSDPPGFAVEQVALRRKQIFARRAERRANAARKRPRRAGAASAADAVSVGGTS
jgi:hypothetical protein